MTVITKIDADVANKSARSATDSNGPTARSATWPANTVLDDVRSSVHERANHLLLDRVACAPASAQLPVSRKGMEGINSVTRLIDGCRSNEVRRSGPVQWFSPSLCDCASGVIVDVSSGKTTGGLHR
jgi:hypothetical protein